MEKLQGVMVESEDSMESLMRQAMAGDGRAYQLILQRSAALLRPYLSRRVYPLAAVDDILQEILISVHKSRHTYSPERPFTPWLYAIARFRLTDHLRGAYKDKLRHAADITDYEQILPEHVTETGGGFEYLEKAIALLPEKQARILTLLHREGYTAKEAAKQMGMTEVAVKVSAHRAYKLLRKKLEHYDNAA